MTVNPPSLSERKCATATPARSTVNPALNGALHALFTVQTGVTGPRRTVPVSPVVGVAEVGEPHAASMTAAASNQCHPLNRQSTIGTRHSVDRQSAIDIPSIGNRQPPID